MQRDDKLHAKLLNFLLDLADTTDFKFAVAKIRRKSDIPTNGFKPTATDLKNLFNPFYIPFGYPNKKSLDKQEYIEGIFSGLSPLLDALPVKDVFYATLLKNYVYYDKFYIDQTKEAYPSFKQTASCQLVDVRFEFEDSAKEGKSKSVYISEMREILRRYPIVVRISPYASGQDIKEFIAANLTTIRAMQKLYGEEKEWSKMRNRKRKGISTATRKTRDFLHQNQHLGTKPLSKILEKRGISLDHEHIRKIISLENKKRERKLVQD